MRCPQCASSDVIEVGLDLKVENDVMFRACRACEATWWERDGSRIALDDVIDLTTAAHPRLRP